VRLRHTGTFVPHGLPSPANLVAFPFDES